jgi:hypothetical protein
MMMIMMMMLYMMMIYLFILLGSDIKRVLMIIRIMMMISMMMMYLHILHTSVGNAHESGLASDVKGGLKRLRRKRLLRPLQPEPHDGRPRGAIWRAVELRQVGHQRRRHHCVVRGTFGVIQGTFGVIRGTLGVIQGTFSGPERSG